eukprot:1122190-Prorocentrum_minimum.AAC.2
MTPHAHRRIKIMPHVRRRIKIESDSVGRGRHLRSRSATSEGGGDGYTTRHCTDGLQHELGLGT